MSQLFVSEWGLSYWHWNCLYLRCYFSFLCFFAAEVEDKMSAEVSSRGRCLKTETGKQKQGICIFPTWRSEARFLSSIHPSCSRFIHLSVYPSCICLLYAINYSPGADEYFKGCRTLFLHTSSPRPSSLFYLFILRLFFFLPLSSSSASTPLVCLSHRHPLKFVFPLCTVFIWMCVCVCVFDISESVEDVTLASCCELRQCVLYLVTIYN